MTIIPMGSGGRTTCVPHRPQPDWPLIVWLAFIAGIILGTGLTYPPNRPDAALYQSGTAVTREQPRRP